MVGKLVLVVGRGGPSSSPCELFHKLPEHPCDMVTGFPPEQVISESKAVANDSHGSHAAVTSTVFYLSRGQPCFSVTGDYTRA